MLAQYHGISRDINTSIARRFLGIVGRHSGGVQGMVRFLPGNPRPLLRLELTNCRVADDAAQVREGHAIGDVPAMTTARVLDGQVVVDGLTQEGLRSLGFGDIDLWDGPYTGREAVLPFAVGEDPVRVILGQYYAIDGRPFTQAAGRVLATSDPPVVQSAPFIPWTVVNEYFVRREQQQQQQQQPPAQPHPSGGRWLQ